MDIVEFLYANKRFNEIVRRVMIGMRLYYPYNIMYMRKIRKISPPPEFVTDAREYYEKNGYRAEKVCEFLADEKSKDTYTKLINLRQSYEKKDIPKYNYFDQYFPIDIPAFSERWSGGEVFVDCGAFNGDIDDAFAKRVKDYSKIFAFEPDRKNIAELEKRKQTIINLHIVRAASSDHEGILRFSEQKKSGSSHVVEGEHTSDEIEVSCTTIDKVLNGGKCDFIKMDIEGAEWEALHGAADTIKKYRPKLAISIYHRDDDMIRIPEYIHDLVPEYKLYVRAHTMGTTETILYALV